MTEPLYVPGSKDYHCTVAVDYWVSRIEAKRGRPFKPVALLNMLWLAANDPWAESPRVNVASSRLVTCFGDRRAVYMLARTLEGLGALRKRSSSTLGTGYVLVKPPFEELPQDVQAELLDMSHTDYRAKPGTRVKQSESNVVLLKPERLKKTQVVNALKEIELTRKQIANALERVAGLPKNDLRYSGQGSAAVQFACEWIARRSPSRVLFNAILVCARQDDDQPRDLHYMFDISTASRRDYLQAKIVEAKALLASRSKKANG